ncbi:MAG: hypothetical protein LC115_08330 [Bacteroidia bacterium]|nr:hypothetical protein [Bacteroidia bacterium]
MAKREYKITTNGVPSINPERVKKMCFEELDELGFINWRKVRDNEMRFAVHEKIRAGATVVDAVERTAEEFFCSVDLVRLTRYRK